MEMLLPLGQEDGPGAEALPHGGLQVGGAPQGDAVLVAAVHVEMLFQVSGQIKTRKLLLAPAGLVQHRDARHAVHPVVADADGLFLVLIGDEVVAAVFPGHLPGADGLEVGAARLFVAELHHPARVDGGEEGVHAVGQLLVGGLGAAIDVYLALQLACLVLRGETLQLGNEPVAGGFGDHPAGLHGVHQQL